MSRPGSYFPIFIKYFLSIANSPPAMVGDLQQVIHKLENVFRIEMFVLGFRNPLFKHVTLTLIRKYKWGNCQRYFNIP